MTHSSIRTSAWTIAWFLAAAGGGAGCAVQRTAEAAPEAPSVLVARATRGTLTERLNVAAEFRPYEEIEVHAKVAGYLKSISVDVGDRVQAGQPIAELEVPELQDESHEAEAAVGRAQEDIKRAQADLERAESAHEVEHAGATRLQAVSKASPKLVSEQDLDEAASRDRTTGAQVATAEAALAGARQQLEVAKAADNKTKTLLTYARITAPFAGVITHRYADPGAMIQAGTSSQTQTLPLVTLSQNARLRAIIAMPESAVAGIHAGTPVDLTVQALGRTFSAPVARTSNRLDPETRTMHTEVDVENPTLEIVPGMYATAAVVTHQAVDALIVPVEALDRSAAGTRVWRVNADHRLDVRPVTTGLETADGVEIRSGLDTGDQVVVGNRGQLKTGMVVTPTTGGAH